MVWLILGPSGVGKSSFGGWLAAKQSWLHLEIDQYPRDGIGVYKLRTEWDTFYGGQSASPLSHTIRKLLEAKSREHCALTFPSNLILHPDQINAGGHLTSIRYSLCHLRNGDYDNV